LRGSSPHVQCGVRRAIGLISAWEGIADNGLEYEAVRSRREAVADAKFHVDFIQPEIRDGKKLPALLPQRQEITDSAQICIIFETDKLILAEIADALAAAQ
jgi:hypothetical protein